MGSPAIRGPLAPTRVTLSAGGRNPTGQPCRSRGMRLPAEGRTARPKRLWRWPGFLTLAVLALGLTVAVDYARSPRTDLRQFDGREVGRLDAAMWRAYYQREQLRLFVLLTESHRTQFHASPTRAVVMGYRAAKAAFAFKDGRSRTEYARALPDLEYYFSAVNDIAATPFDARAAARDELEWWIIRREPTLHTKADWEQLIARVASTMYHVPSDRVSRYAKLRVEAMAFRDQRGAAITDADWAHITALLQEAWTSLGEAVRAA